MPSLSPGASLWPHPTESVTISDAARLLGVSRTTLSRAIANIKNGKGVRSKKPEIVTVAEIFANKSEGAIPSVKAEILIHALGIPASRVNQTPPPQESTQKEVRYRPSRKLLKELKTMPPGKLLDTYESAHNDLSKKDRLNTRRLVHEIVQTLLARDIAVQVDRLKRIQGTPIERFKAFATLADWSANAGPEDFRLFAFASKNSRPVDVALLPRRARPNAKFVFMNVEAWLDAMKKGLDVEGATIERDAVGHVTPKPQKHHKGPLRV